MNMHFGTAPLQIEMPECEMCLSSKRRSNEDDGKIEYEGRQVFTLLLRCVLHPKYSPSLCWHPQGCSRCLQSSSVRIESRARIRRIDLTKQRRKWEKLHCCDFDCVRLAPA